MSIPGGEARSNLILNARGDPMVRAAGSTAWAGASRDTSSLRKWDPSYGSADADMVFDTAEIHARSRDLDRNEGLARDYFDTTTAFGDQHRPRARIERGLAQISKERLVSTRFRHSARVCRFSEADVPD